MDLAIESRVFTQGRAVGGKFGMNIAVWLARSAERDGARPALYRGLQEVADYAGFHRAALGVAGDLRARGIGPGSQVAIFMKNAPEYLIAVFGILYAGAAAVPINAKLHAREAAFILGDSRATLCFAGAEEAASLTDEQIDMIVIPSDAFDSAVRSTPLAAVQSRAPDDLAWLFYTSGTTGTPKGVMITHGMLMAMSLSYTVDVDDVRATDAAIYAAPLSHGAGLYSFMHARAGARHVCPASGGFDAAEVFDLAAQFGSIHMFAAPTMVKRMTLAAQQAGTRGAGLRTVVYGGGPMYNADIIDAVDQFGDVFVQIYGQGECPMAITALSRAAIVDRCDPQWRARLGSVGRAQSMVEIRIADAEGQEMPTGQTGEIMVRGTPVMAEYWNNALATANTISKGWLMTGDMGCLDADGYLTLQDRSKDVIITGGSNVYPREVEEVLLQHPGVHEVSVVGRAHPEWGEEIVAFIVGDATDAALDALCLAHIARFKRPKTYLRVESLPKNNYGKVLKTALRHLLE